MEQLNLLVNAGHNPSSLARQMVRYLRNSLMAKLGGEQTELLQISGDERARAVRTALLFTEEELTRNLQIVLRTFDDLNYRQEQRFHLELGLLKLIHAQRLLPIEELLSGVSAARPANPASASTPRPTASPARPAASTAAPAHSPFGPSEGGGGFNPRTTHADSKRALAPEGRFSSFSSGISGDSADSSLVSPVTASSPFPAATATATVYATTITEGALAVAPQAVVSAPTIEQIRHAVVSALVEGGHVSASQLLGTGKWTIDGASLRIEVAGMGKKMLALTINAAAEKIIRQELQRLGAPTRLLVVPGEGTAPTSAPMPAPLAGSIQEAALANPLVQRAREIFKAEVRSVVDLRQK
jgi:DNA polymerase-3 subunit gamma/tau